MTIDVEKLRLLTLKFISQCRFDGGKLGEYLYSEFVEKPTLYSSTYVTMIKSLYNALPEKSECNEWVKYINSYQEEDGFFKDPVIYGDGWYKDDPLWCGRMHLTCHIIVALSCLDHIVKKPFSALKKFCDSDFLCLWLSERDWETQNISTTGNEVMNVGTLLQYSRDFHNDTKAGNAMEIILDWLTENHLNSETGLWGNLDLSKPRLLSETIMAAYHFWPLFTYDKIKVPFIEKAIDIILSSQNPNGGFGWGVHNPTSPYESSACEDIDSIEPLCRFYFLSNYRKDDIFKVLEKAYLWVVQNQMRDGGFVFTKNRAFFYGHPQLSSSVNKGTMFATWFRTLSLAYIGKVLKNSDIGKYPWNFVKCPGYQFWEQ